MKKVAISFSTKDRVELSQQSVASLVAQKCDLFWIDGSVTPKGISLPTEYPAARVHADIKGGADAAIVYGLSTLLADDEYYDYVGLVENDVLLDPDWFEPTMELFERGEKDGLHVGAVSARAYEDRILIQRDGYAVMHNLGAGMIIFSREAAELVLANCRTGHTLENRRAFMQVSGLDIARWNGFTRDAHPTCMDWQFDRILAQHGYASLALTPSKCEMIGQDPPLEQQGLKLVREPVEALRNDEAFKLFEGRMDMLRDNRADIHQSLFFTQDDGSDIVMPHQLSALWGDYSGEWQLKWTQAHGPFVYVAAEDNASLKFMASGPLSVLVSGGETGGSVQIEDHMTGYAISIQLEPEKGQVLSLSVPASIATRTVKVTALRAGVIFYGVNIRGSQMIDSRFSFNHSMLPQP